MNGHAARTIVLRALPLVVISMLLAACGGGGASGGAPAPGAAATAPSPAPVAPPVKTTANKPPTASVWVSTTLGEAPLQMSFDGSGSTDADGTIRSWSWDFGDGRIADGRTVAHTYGAPGVYQARLTVVDDADASADAVRTITVQVSEPQGHSISGRIRIQASTATDSDTNDPNMPTVSNDDFDRAQTVANPATVGGYVGVAGSGRDTGALFERGDHSDVYRFTALGGEAVALAIAAGSADLDLRLYDADRVQIDESMGVGAHENLAPIAAAGDYYVQVTTFGDAASNYVLTIGQTPIASTGALRSSAAFVPEEFILGPELAPSASTAAAPAAVPEFDLGAAARRGAGRGEATLARLSDRWQMRSVGLPGAAPLTELQARKRRTLEAVKALRASGRYAWVEPNWIHQPMRVPGDEFFPNQWHYQSIHLPQAWDLTTGSADVVVAVIDTGILSAHPAFTDPAFPSDTKLVSGYDFISDPASALDGDGLDANPEDEGTGGFGASSSFHGSHVAGVVAARTDDGDGSGGGIAGVGWNTRLMPLRVLGAGGGTSADLIEALKYAGGMANASGTLPERPADIINLSLGSPEYSEAERSVIDRLRERGIIIIAAAGNDSGQAPAFPAAYEGVVSVSATTITDSAAYYSNRGPSIDIAAPGGDTSTDINGDGIADGVLSALGDDSDGNPATPPTPRLGPMAGTSMAAPHVAGVAALMKAVHPELTPEVFDTLLAAGMLTRDLGEPGRDDIYGHGLIDAQRAVIAAMQAAGGEAGDLAVLTTSPAALNFGPFTDMLEFRLGNAGSAPLSALPPLADVPWLTVEAVNVDAIGLGVYRARVHRDLLPADGIFSSTLRITSDANMATVSIRVQRSSVDLSADAGHHYVVLTAEDGHRALYRTTALARAGEYDFALDNVAPGRYRLYAGTDVDHDDLICDTGEACGAWHTMDAPTVLEVDADIDDIEFITAFRGTLSPSGALPFGAVDCPACSPR